MLKVIIHIFDILIIFIKMWREDIDIINKLYVSLLMFYIKRFMMFSV
jgi:hypothetical protein